MYSRIPFLKRDVPGGEEGNSITNLVCTVSLSLTHYTRENDREIESLSESSYRASDRIGYTCDSGLISCFSTA